VCPGAPTARKGGLRDPQEKLECLREMLRTIPRHKGTEHLQAEIPGHPPDVGRPFTLRRGGSVHDVAQLVHRGMASELRFARVWGASVGFEGQQVSHW
jgi:ribosome-interacting GTPase 1